MSMVFLAAASLVCLLAPLLTPYEYDVIDLSQIRQSPSRAHWLGTDDLGRDLWTRILYGGRISLLIGLIAAAVGTGVGTLVGAVAGFFGGRTDGLLMRVTDVAYAIPSLPLLIVLASFTDSAFAIIAIIIGLLSWMTTARVVRSEVLTIREMPYVEAARSVGAGSGRIIWRHVLPNALGPIVVGGTLAVGNALIVESSLSYLGLGVQPPTPTWGNMLRDAQSTMSTEPWLTVFPGLAIFFVVLAVNFIGDGIQDALDPKARTE
jgi:peptide/nickel transport system permease protein